MMILILKIATNEFVIFQGVVMNSGGQLIVGSLVQQSQQNTPSQVEILQFIDLGFLN